jgi:ribosome-binding protein aMBF1 (putative translation factor)
MIEKLEKELGITLVENVADVHAGGSHSGASLTLGDFIKKKIMENYKNPA